MIFYLPSLVFVLIGLLNAWKTYSSLRWLDKKKSKEKTQAQEHVDFVLLLPVLEEQDLIAEALARIRQIKYPPGKLKTVFITTQKEQKKDNMPTTAEVIQKILPKSTRYTSLHYPYKKGVKADQLNWAIKQLEKKNYIRPQTVIGVYDIDSVILPNVMSSVSKIFNQTHTNVAQQPSLYFKNWNKLPLLGKSFAIYQTAYGCFYEINSWRRWDKALSPMRYCTGHGMFVKHQFLKKIGYFPSPLEDTRFGHICAFLKEPIEIVPIFDDCETTPSSIQRIRQASVWFSGDVQYLGALPVARSIGRVSTLFTAWLIANKTYRTLVWAFQGFIVMATLLVAIYYKNPALILAVMFFSYMPAGVLFMNRSKLKRLSQNHAEIKIPALAVLCLPFTALLKSLGPWYAAYRYIRAKIYRTDFLYPKTKKV